MLALNIAAGRRPRLASLHRTDKLEDFGAALQIIQFARAQAAKQARPTAPFRRPSRLGALQQDVKDVVRDFHGHLVAVPCDRCGGDLCWRLIGYRLGYLVDAASRNRGCNAAVQRVLVLRPPRCRRPLRLGCDVDSRKLFSDAHSGIKM